MLLQVHDELIFEAPDKDVEKACKLIDSVMEKAALPAVEISVPPGGGSAGRRQLGCGALTPPRVLSG